MNKTTDKKPPWAIALVGFTQGFLNEEKKKVLLKNEEIFKERGWGGGGQKGSWAGQIKRPNGQMESLKDEKK